LSATPPAADWWQASDGLWYPPHLHPDVLADTPDPAPAVEQPAPASVAKTPPAAPDAPPGHGWWQASDGRWYPPHLHPDAGRAAAAAWAPATSRSATGTGGGWASGPRPGDDLITSAPGQRSLKVRLRLDDPRRLALVALVLLVLVGGGVGIALALGSGGGAAANRGTSTTRPNAQPSTTVASVGVTSQSAAALEFVLTDLPNGWADYEAGAPVRANGVPAGACSFAQGRVQWYGASPTYANSTGNADEYVFDDVIVTASDSGAKSALLFAESPTYLNTCLHPTVLDTLQPFVADKALSKCPQDLEFGGDQISSALAVFSSSPAVILHWIGYYECPTNQQVSYMYVDEIVMAAGRGAVDANWIGITAAPSAALEQKVMGELSVRAADNGL
jgi:hypothetical protein